MIRGRKPVANAESPGSGACADKTTSYTYDLASAMPYSGLQEDERTEIWDDDVHFTPKGYDLMGRLVAERMLELMPAVGIEEPNKKKGEQEVKKLD